MTRAQTLALVLTAAIGAVVLLAATGAFRDEAAGGLVTEMHAEPLGDVRALAADLAMGSGRLRVRTIESDNAFEAQITRPARRRVRVEYTSGRLRIAEGQGGWRRRAEPGLGHDWSVGLMRRVPLDLDLAAGSANASVDLTGMTGSAELSTGSGEIQVSFGAAGGAVESLEVRTGSGDVEIRGLGYARARDVEARTGSGQITLDLSGSGGQWRTSIDVRAGSGSITLIVPEGVGVRIRIDDRQASRAQLPGFRQAGDEEFVNDAWAGASSTVDVEVSLGSGAFEVRGR